MSEKRTGLVLHSDLFTKHDPGIGHPESTARYHAITKRLKASGILAHDRIELLGTRVATDDELAACHAREYIKLVGTEIASGVGVLSTGDTNICKESLEVAQHAAGATLEAVDHIVSGKLRSAFCAVRPPGHHATPDRGMGFCVFNNAAIAARYAQKKHGIEKVAIIDWDVHHGNGTQDIFYDDETVFYFSTHQSPWYPGTGHVDETGKGKGRGKTLNAPLPAGTGVKLIQAAFEDRFLPAMEKFKPQLVVISAGFDSRKDDPLGEFKLTDDDFSLLTGLLTNLAKKHADSRVLSVLEGGYNLKGLASATESHVKALLSADESC
jgi:acetoin utilization deacetylase AcuC-like enzyme